MHWLSLCAPCAPAWCRWQDLRGGREGEANQAAGPHEGSRGQGQQPLLRNSLLHNRSLPPSPLRLVFFTWPAGVCVHVQVAEACDIIQDVHVETYGSLDKKEKLDFLLEQIRLTLAKKDFVRTIIISKKVRAGGGGSPTGREESRSAYRLVGRDLMRVDDSSGDGG